MKMNFAYVIIAVVSLVIIAVSLGSTIAVAPYRKNTFFSNEFPYEGFQSLDYGNRMGGAMDAYSSQLINGAGVDCKKVDGFDGLFCKPFVADAKIDTYSDAKGDVSCTGSSSGLTNSKGGLCLDATQKALLSTRGGNATGNSAEIGK